MLNFRISVALIAMIAMISYLPHRTESVAVISIDLGTEFVKIAIVKPGVPMEIVLNKESRRKTPLAVSLRNNEREFGEMAMQQLIKKPKTAYVQFSQLLAKSLDNPVVTSFREKYPYYDIREDNVTKTIYFQHDQSTRYTPEELLAMFFEYARELAADFGEQSINGAVIAVPTYFNQAERRSVLRAARMVDLQVLQLINTNTAAGLNYGVFRRKDFNNTGITHMFYDMGSAGTTVTVASFHLIKYRDDYEANPQLVIRGIGFDRELGGAQFTQRLAQHLARVFKEKTKKDIYKNPKAIVKLYKEAERVKNVLSANTDHWAQVESLMDDVDFKTQVTRAEFEKMCEDLFERVAKPIKDALITSEISDSNDIASVILVGGMTRTPLVQDILLKTTGKKELGKNLNTDEATALGAVYQAAYESKGYKVKRFYIKDANVYPIQVSFDRFTNEPDTNKNEKAEQKKVERVLFDRANNFPQKKVMTFSRHNRDFDFEIKYGETNFFMNERNQKILGKSPQINRVNVIKLKELFAEHPDEDTKGLKCHFRLDESGLLKMEKIDITFEKYLNRTTRKEKNDGSTFEKLSNTITNFFGSSENEDDKDGSVTDQQQDKQKKTTTASPTKKNKETAKNETVNATQPTVNVTYIKEDVKFQVTRLDHVEFTEQQMKDAVNKLELIKMKEKQKKLKAAAVNSIESFIFDTKDKLEQSEFQSLTTVEERSLIKSRLQEADNWMTEENHDTIALETFESKLKELKQVSKDFFFRLDERKERPKKLDELETVLKKSSEFLSDARNSTGTDLALTHDEWSSLDKLINGTQEWKTYQINEQAKLKDSDNPKLLASNIQDKIGALKREVQYLLTKIKYFRPKTTTTTTTTTTANPKANNKTESSNKSETITSTPENTSSQSKNKDQKDSSNTSTTEEPKTTENAEL